jgi:hypothetical protein
LKMEGLTSAPWLFLIRFLREGKWKGKWGNHSFL